MPSLPGWGTAAGYVTKWLDSAFDKRKRLDAQIASIENKLKVVTGIPGKERVYADLVSKLSRLRSTRARTHGD